MLNFVLRRLLSSVAVLLVATFLVFVLADIAVDPLEDLRTSTAPNKEALIAGASRCSTSTRRPPCATSRGSAESPAVRSASATSVLRGARTSP